MDRTLLFTGAVQYLIKQFSSNPELYYLLLREAEETGTPVSSDQVQTVLANARLAAQIARAYAELQTPSYHA